MRLGFERRRGHDDPRNRFSPSGIIAHHVLDIVDTAEHRHVADRLAAVCGRRRQHADRPKLLDGAALDRAQQHLGVGGAADQQGRRRPFGLGMAANARIAEIAIAETERAQREHLEKPIENDGDTAEQHRCLAVRCRENEGIVQHDERDRQNGRHAQDVQRIGERNETPFRRRQVENVTDDDAERDEERQNAQQQRQAGIEGLASVKSKIETCKQRNSCRQPIMRCDQEIATGQLRKRRHFNGRLRRRWGFAAHPWPADILSAARMPAIMAGLFRKIPRPPRSGA